MDVNRFLELPLMGIVRGIPASVIKPLTDAAISAGLKTIEITMNTAGATGLIRDMVQSASGRLTIGAGTVLSAADVRAARDAGATFIVSPTYVPEVIEQCSKDNIPVFPGALTPQEIYAAWQAGATMVKVFPAKFFGPAYFKEIKGPFNDIKLLACGGVTVDTIGPFFAAGADAVAFGASIFKKERFAAGDFSSIEKDIKALISAYYTKSA